MDGHERAAYRWGAHNIKGDNETREREGTMSTRGFCTVLAAGCVLMALAGELEGSGIDVGSATARIERDGGMRVKAPDTSRQFIKFS